MKTTIALDAMGSDNRPDPELQAAIDFTQNSQVRLLLVGQEQLLKAKLDSLPGQKNNIEIVNADETLEMSDHIQQARAKKNNSMLIGIGLVKEGCAQAFVTAGNTGMAMYFGTKIFGLIPGVIRPCLCATFPVKNGKCVIVDIGANAECRPEFLVQFAQMGAVYSSSMIKPGSPRIGLIANGEEEGKGNELVKATGPIMKEFIPGFVGNIEGKEIFEGCVDVAVTDGFTGNVLLKSVEAVAKLILSTLKDELMSTTRTKLGAMLAKPAFNNVRKLLDPSEVGAVPLLGLNGLVFVGHGRSDAKAMLSAIKEAQKAVESDLLNSLRNSISFTGEKA